MNKRSYIPKRERSSGRFAPAVVSSVRRAAAQAGGDEVTVHVAGVAWVGVLHPEGVSGRAEDASPLAGEFLRRELPAGTALLDPLASTAAGPARRAFDLDDVPHEPVVLARVGKAFTPLSQR